MSDNLDLPIALRRTPRRRTSVITAQTTQQVPTITASRTPSRSRNKKRVRFSDPGPDTSGRNGSSSPSSTGLTPMVKRSSLGEPSPKRRRHSTPAATRTASAPGNEEQRRTRSGGVSQKMSSSDSAIKKSGARTRTRQVRGAAEITAAQAEIKRLHVDLAGRDAEIRRLHETTLVQDTERIVQLEKQIEDLQRELARQQEDVEDGLLSTVDLPDGPSHSFYDWTLAARDPFSDSFLDDGEGLGDVTVAEVACSTPSRRNKTGPSTSACTSFPTPPCTSPVQATPCSIRMSLAPATPHSAQVGIQADMPDAEKETLRGELESLGLELARLADTLDSHTAMQRRLSDRMSIVHKTQPTVHDGEEIVPGLEQHLDSVLQTLAERTVALTALDSSLTSLGFPGSDATEMVASIASGFRAARLELEYLTPGEITLPLSSHGAEVLDLVLTRLRDLARKAHEDEETIDEYHALELSLRQQLTARVDCMDGMNRKLKKQESELGERDDRISELEIGLDRLKGAADAYRRDISELEALVQRLETDGKTSESKLRTDMDDMRSEVAQKTGAIAELETKLATTVAEAMDLRMQLETVQRRKAAETKVRNKSNGAALALRDARVAELRREIYGINDSLRRAHETIRKLRVDNAGLERRVEEEQETAQATINALKAELERASVSPATGRRTRSSSVAGKTVPATPEPGSFLSGDLARSAAAKRKKRRYDSGLGFLDEEEDDIEFVA